VRQLRRALVFTIITAVALGTSAFAGLSASAASPAVKLNLRTGPPTTLVKVKGSGFTPFEAADVYFDTTDMALASSNSAGAFSINFPVPATAQPGLHYVTAVGRRSGVSAQSTFTVQTNWPEFHFGPALTGLNPFENTLNPSTVSGLDEAWTFTTGGAVESSPAIVNGVLYVGSDDGNVYALNATTGALKWSAALGTPIKSAPAVASNAVYVTSGTGSVYALNASTGAPIWTDDLSILEPSGFGAPIVFSGKVLVQGSSGNVYGLSTADGFADWVFVPANPACFGTSVPSAKNGTVYASGACSGIAAIKASSGAQVWATPFDGGSAPTIGTGVVYSGALGMFFSYVAANGNPAGCDADFFGGDEMFTAPALASGELFLGTDDGFMYAMTASNCSETWSFRTGGAIASSPAVADGVVYFGSADGSVYAVDSASGSELWSFPIGTAVHSSPAVVNGEVYVGSSDGNVYAFALPGAGANAPRPTIAMLHPDRRLRPSH
jgi:outer membrane protein assembly factor BamB